MPEPQHPAIQREAQKVMKSIEAFQPVLENYVRACARGDRKALRRLLAPEFALQNGSNSTLNKDKILLETSWFSQLFIGNRKLSNFVLLVNLTDTRAEAWIEQSLSGSVASHPNVRSVRLSWKWKMLWRKSASGWVLTKLEQSTVPKNAVAIRVRVPLG